MGFDQIEQQILDYGVKPGFGPTTEADLRRFGESLTQDNRVIALQTLVADGCGFLEELLGLLDVDRDIGRDEFLQAKERFTEFQKSKSRAVSPTTVDAWKKEASLIRQFVRGFDESLEKRLKRLQDRIPKAWKKFDELIEPVSKL